LVSEPPEQSALESASGLARITARAWLRTALWSLETSARVGSRLVGTIDPEGRLTELVSDVVGDRFGSRSDGPPSLRERGERLLEASADVRYQQGTHPAYERILADLAPDEARILRLLVRDGPQPSVDVRTGLAFVPGRGSFFRAFR
jgi:hypothetical protein